MNSTDHAADRPRPFALRPSALLSARVDTYALLLALLSLLALGPLLQSGYFWGAHDARHSVYFLFEFDRVFQDGVWYPRWFPDMTYGYGYPLFNIYGPLAFYAGEFFHLLGADFVTAVKLVFASGWVLSGLAMYGFVRRLFDSRPAAFVSGLAYVFMPYHLVEVYVRAALAESVALLFLPLALWAFYETAVQPRPRAVLFAAFGYGGMVFAHNGIALLFSPILGLWILFLLARRWRARGAADASWFRRVLSLAWPTAAGLGLGLALASIFLIPLALEYKYINVAQWTANYYNYAEHFVQFFQLFSPTWGFGISQPGPDDGLSFQLGIMPVILGVFSLYAAARGPARLRAYLLFFLAVTLVVALLMFDFSLPLWKLFGLASVAQFPWRLLTLLTLSLSVLAGSILLGGEQELPSAGTLDALPDPDSLSLAALVLGALIVLAGYPYITAQNMAQASEGPVGLAGLMRFESSANEMTGSTAYAEEQPQWSPLADNYIAGKKVKTKVDSGSIPPSLYVGPTQYGLHTNGEILGINAQDDNTTLRFYVQYYPGWRAYLLKPRSTEIIKELEIKELGQPFGLIQVTVPKGEYFLWLRFEDTPPRTIGTAISALALAFAVGLLGWDLWRGGGRPAQGAALVPPTPAHPNG